MGGAAPLRQRRRKTQGPPTAGRRRLGRRGAAARTAACAAAAAGASKGEGGGALPAPALPGSGSKGFSQHVSFDAAPPCVMRGQRQSKGWVKGLGRRERACGGRRAPPAWRRACGGYQARGPDARRPPSRGPPAGACPTRLPPRFNDRPPPPPARAPARLPQQERPARHPPRKGPHGGGRRSQWDAVPKRLPQHGPPAQRPAGGPGKARPPSPMIVGSSSRWRLLAGMMARPRATWRRGVSKGAQRGRMHPARARARARAAACRRGRSRPRCVLLVPSSKIGTKDPHPAAPQSARTRGPCSRGPPQTPSPR
jgi:hypothetical protein